MNVGRYPGDEEERPGHASPPHIRPSAHGSSVSLRRLAHHDGGLGGGPPGSTNRNCHASHVKGRVRERYVAQVDGLRALGALVAIMWAVELVNALDSYRLDHDGIVPRNLSHLDGIVFAPFLHASFSHLLTNTVPFVILGFAIALAGTGRLLLVSLIVALVSGLGTWLTAAGGTVTVGASGVVFGYATYLISRGLFNRRIVEASLGIIVLLFFGAALISDLIPHSGISWEAHLFGGIGGVLAAAALARPARGRPNAAGATSLPAALR
jgi:membrane associated rhomboid family serine protease